MMSRNAKIQPQSKKPYCKVCFDAGRPESDYSSHWVRSLPDRNGNTTVTCPTLLDTECRYCYKLGHTAKFCPVLEKSKKEKERADRKLKVSEQKQRELPQKQAMNSSVFDVLRIDSDDEEIKVSYITKPVESFPSLGSSTKNVQVTLPAVQPEIKTGWAAIAAKPKEDTFMKQIEERSILKSLPQSVTKPKPEVKPAPWVPKDYSADIYTKSWADWSDSDSDEDEVEVKPWTTVCATQTLPPGWSTSFAEDDDW